MCVGDSLHRRRQIRRLFTRELPKGLWRALDDLLGLIAVDNDQGLGDSFRVGLGGLHLLE